MKKSLLRSTITVGSLTFLSRIFGLIRDITFASFFGASAAMDAFSVAFRIPNLFRRFLGEGALNQAFVPVFSEYRVKHSMDDLRLFLSQISGTLGIVLLGLTILGMLFAPQIVMMFAAGFKADPIKFELTVELVRVMFPYVFFICLAALMAGILNSLNLFALSTITMMILNICMITAAYLSQFFANPLIIVGYGVLVAGFLQLLIPYCVVWNRGMMSRPKIAFGSAGVRRVMTLMVPALIGSSSAQINMLINTQLASRLPTGSVTWLYYSDRLTEFVLGTVAVAMGTVLLPRLSKLHAETDHKTFGYTVDWGIRLAFIIGIPSTIGLMMMARPLLSVLFMHGHFSEFDVDMSARSLIACAFSILAYFVLRVLAPVYYARQDTKTPVKFGLISIAVNVCLQFILVRYYAHAGLALSSAIAAWVNAILLIVGLWRADIYKVTGIFNREFLALIPANVLLIIFLSQVIGWDDFWIHGRFIMRLTALLGVVLGAVCLYFFALHFSGFHLRRLKSPA